MLYTEAKIITHKHISVIVCRRKVKKKEEKERKKERKVLQVFAHVTWKVRVCGNYDYALPCKYLKMRVLIL